MKFLSPSAQLLDAHPDVSVSEEDGWWLKGRILKEHETCFELSHELATQIPPEYRKKVFIHERVPVIYLGLYSGCLNLAEFWSGQWVLKPRDLDTTRQITLLCQLLQDVRPMPVVRYNSAPVVYHAARTATTGTMRY